MPSLIIRSLDAVEELDRLKMADVHGGRMKLPFQRASVDNLLTSPQGDPVAVYVDGVLVNSVSSGYAPR